MYSDCKRDMWVRLIVCALFSTDITWNMTKNLWNASRYDICNETRAKPADLTLQMHCESVEAFDTRGIFYADIRPPPLTLRSFRHVFSVYSKCTFINEYQFSQFVAGTQATPEWSLLHLRQLQSWHRLCRFLPSEVKSFDLYITTFLWRQSTQHEGVIPIAPKWARMSSYDLVVSLITTL